MHATTTEPQHQAQNGLAVLLGVWRLNLVWPSPQFIRDVLMGRLVGRNEKKTSKVDASKNLVEIIIIIINIYILFFVRIPEFLPEYF